MSKERKPSKFVGISRVGEKGQIVIPKEARDMFGIAPCPDPSHPMYGLYKFKQGFGGDVYHQLGCWDYPLEKEKYDYFCACEMNMQGYYRN